MAQYCTNLQSEPSQKSEENKNLPQQTAMHGSSLGVKECLTEYSLQDKVEALKNILLHNEKYAENQPTKKDVITGTEITHGVKECLQVEKNTPFQTLVKELKDTVMNSYWNKEVGKTRYQVPNLPIGMNPLETTFGKKVEYQTTVAEIFKPRKSENEIDDDIVREMYRKSHNAYQPEEQIKRNYETPFDANSRFGKRGGIYFDGTRAKKLLTWINYDPVSLANCIQADFTERTQPRVGEVKDNKRQYLNPNAVYGKTYKREIGGALKALSDCPVSSEVQLQRKYLEHLNTLRQKLKKRIPEVPFLDIYEDLYKLDVEYTDFLSQDKVFDILDKYRIYTEKELFVPLLNILNIRKEGKVKYRALVDLLNWKCDFPTLPRVNSKPLTVDT